MVGKKQGINNFGKNAYLVDDCLVVEDIEEFNDGQQHFIIDDGEDEEKNNVSDPEEAAYNNKFPS